MHPALHAASVMIAAVMGTVTAAQTYPAKPIRFIAPFPPGGTSDIIARVAAQKLTDALGKQVLVDNRGGASGTIGYDIGAKAPADGYTLILTSMGGLVTNQFLFKKLPFDPMNDFTHISQLATAGQVLVVHPSVQAKTAQDVQERFANLGLGRCTPRRNA